MPVNMDDTQFSSSFIKATTINGVVGTPRLVNTGEATDIFPLAVVLTDSSGNSYTAGSGGGGAGTVSPSLADGVYTDNTNAYYVRRDILKSDGTFAVSYTNLDGTAATPGTGLRPIGVSVAVSSLPSLPAGNNAIGQVGGKTATVSATPTVTAGTYAAGNEVGQLLTFANILSTAQSGILQSIKLSLKIVTGVGFKLWLFSGNPTNTTWTDKTAPAINAADIPLLIDVFPLSSPDSGLGTHTLYTLDGIGKAVNGASTSLYAILTTTGAPVFTTTADVVAVTLSVLQD
jgi:hypothetical protein